MLNGLYPILIFNFSKLEPDLQAAVSNIPVVREIVNKIGLPPIPVYLDEEFTGVAIDGEEKNIEIETSTETTADGSTPQVKQKGINSTVTVSMKCSSNSIAMTLISALADLVFEKVTSKEYSITYLHGATTVFNGLLHSFNISQQDDLYMVKLELSKSSAKIEQPKGVPTLEKYTDALPIPGAT